jgi:hypothetical protein
MRVANVKVVPARTVVLPATVVGYDLDMDGERTNEDKRTKVLERTIAVEFEQQARAKGASPVSFDKVRACGDNCVSLLSTAIRWGAKVATEIAVAQHGPNHSGKSSVADWQNGRDFRLHWLRALQRAVDADFTLICYLQDVHETAGRQFAEANLGRRAVRTIANEADYKRIAVICALELASGRMVWCSSLADRFMGKYVDITSPDEGRALLKELLAEF